MREPSVTVEHENGLPAALAWVKDMATRGLAAGPVVIVLRRPKRSDAQNRRLWGMLTDLSRDVDWWGRKLTPEEWKIVCSASLKKQQVVPDLDGTGFVALGMATSKMSVKEMVELQDLIEAFGNSKSVRWTNDVQTSG
jgi:hypothetical protein